MSDKHDFIVKNGVLIRYRGPGGDVWVPAGVKEIGPKAFAGCRALTRAVLPEGTRRVGDRAFFDCAGLAQVQLPQGLKEIGQYAFGGCVSLFGLEIPRGVKKVGKGAFAGCASLTRLVLPQSVKKPKYSAFRGCPLSASAPYLPVKTFKQKNRPQAAQHFAAACLAELEMRRKIRAGYLGYIRSRRKRLYPAAVESEELLWLMLKKKMVPKKEIRLLLEETDKQEKPAAKAAVMGYGKQRFLEKGSKEKAGRNKGK